MNELHIDKTHWKKYRFGDVAIQTKEVVDIENTSLTRYVAGEHMFSEDIHLRKWGTVGDGYLGPAFIRKFNKGDILYGSRRTYLKKVAIADFDGITANTTFVIKANEDLIEPVLLAHLMLSHDFTEYSVKNSRGSVNPYINWKDIADYEFLLPPKAEQKRLAELLWAADEVVEKEKRERDALKSDLRTELLQIGNYSNDSQLPLNIVCDILDNKRKPLSSRERYKIKGSYPYYGVNGIVDYINTYIFDEDLVLLAEDCGNYSNFKEESIAYYITGKSWINNHVHVLKAKDEIILSKWLYYSLAHKDTVKYINGSTRGKLCSSELSRISLYVPTLEQQRNLCTDIERKEQTILIIQKQIALSQQIKQELINKVF